MSISEEIEDATITADEITCDHDPSPLHPLVVKKKNAAWSQVTDENTKVSRLNGRFENSRNLGRILTNIIEIKK